MNDSTIRLSADTSALTDSLSKIEDAVSSSAAAMGVMMHPQNRQRLPMPPSTDSMRALSP